MPCVAYFARTQAQRRRAVQEINTMNSYLWDGPR